jgi:hypothetical protein
MAVSDLLSGGCHCRCLRYEIGERPGAAGYCHCRTCQRLTGAPDDGEPMRPA